MDGTFRVIMPSATAILKSPVLGRLIHVPGNWKADLVFSVHRGQSKPEPFLHIVRGPAAIC
jgi:hypothetical protein